MIKNKGDKPAEGDGDNAGVVLSDLEECRFGEIKVLEGRVAPTTVIVGEGVVGRAEVSGGDGDGAGEAPFGIIIAPHFVARPAADAGVEQRSAQRRCVRTVSLAVQISIAAGPS